MSNKRQPILGLGMLILGLCSSPLFAAPKHCAQIKDGSIVDNQQQTIEFGFDQWGYNYQARMFSGYYANASRPEVPVTEDLVHLQMKWSDSWLSNKDCDYSGTLDRGGDGDDTGSKGWLTNHENGAYEDEFGELHHYSYFVKIVYLPDNAAQCPEQDKIWGTYCVVQETLNDPAQGITGKVIRDRLIGVGLGHFK